MKHLTLHALALVAASAAPSLASAQVEGITQPLVPAPFDRCSDGEKATARRAERLALYITQDAIIDPLLDYVGPDGRPHWILERYFAGDRTWNAFTREELKTRFHTLHDRMAEGDVQIKCRDCEDANAQVVPVFTDRITFCPAYFETPRSYQAAVFIHELSHETFWTSDDAYGRAPGRPWDESSRKNAYPEIVDFEEPFDLAEAYEAVTISLIGEHFDTLFRDVYGAPITEDRYEDELDRVDHGRDYRRELGAAKRFFAGVAGGRGASEVDLDLMREHLVALGEDATFGLFAASAEYDPLAIDPALAAARAYLEHWASDEAWNEGFFRGQFAAKFVAL